ncbi:MAG: CoA pyrophosphatase [Myxococcales bacterium]|nr:CoA pyrophosphatase [Myxococcales bacterium]
MSAFAALREAREEIGLPGDRVEILGLLDDFPTVSGKMIVTPVVGRITDLPPLKAEPGEVARIFTVPLDALRVRDGWTIRYHEADGQRWPIHFFQWEGELLWGLSAYVTLQLLSLLPEGGPIDLPPPYGQGPLPDANAKPWKA